MKTSGLPGVSWTPFSELSKTRLAAQDDAWAVCLLVFGSEGACVTGRRSARRLEWRCKAACAWKPLVHGDRAHHWLIAGPAGLKWVWSGSVRCRAGRVPQGHGPFDSWTATSSMGVCRAGFCRRVPFSSLRRRGAPPVEAQAPHRCGLDGSFSAGRRNPMGESAYGPAPTAPGIIARSAHEGWRKPCPLRE